MEKPGPATATQTTARRILGGRVGLFTKLAQWRSHSGEFTYALPFTVESANDDEALKKYLEDHFLDWYEVEPMKS